MESTENNSRNDIYGDIIRYSKTDDVQEKIDTDGLDFNYEYNKAATLVKTGDIPGEGRYSCTNCGTDITMNKGNRVPACPRCNNTLFTTIN